MKKILFAIFILSVFLAKGQNFTLVSNWDSSSDITQGGIYNLSTVCTIDGAVRTRNYSYTSPVSVMFRLRTTDPTCLDTKRSQLTILPTWGFLDTMEKFQFALYYPSSFSTDSREESHFTITFGDVRTTPALELVVVNNKIYLRQTFDSNCVSTPVTDSVIRSCSIVNLLKTNIETNYLSSNLKIEKLAAIRLRYINIKK